MDKPHIPREIWIMVAAAGFIAMGFGLISPILPQFASSFAVPMALASAVVSVFAGSRLLFAPVSGRLIDRLGSRKIYLTGLAIVAVTTGAIGFAQEFWHIMVLRALSGLGSTMFTVSAMALIVKLSPVEIRGRSSSAYASAFLIGNIIGPVIGALLSSLGMRWPFVIYGVALLAAMAVVWRGMPVNVDRHEAATNENRPMNFLEALKHPSYRAALVSAFANGWSNLGVRIAVLPLFAAAIFHQGGAIAGLAMATFALGNAVALQFSGRLADSIGRKPMVLAGLVTNGVFTGIMGFSDSMWPLFIFSAIAGAGAGMLNPAQQAVVADVIGPTRSGGRVLATFQMAQDGGSILGPIVVGALASICGFSWGFVISGVISLVAAGAWIFSQETLVREKASVGKHPEAVGPGKMCALSLKRRCRERRKAGKSHNSNLG